MAQHPMIDYTVLGAPSLRPSLDIGATYRLSLPWGTLILRCLTIHGQMRVLQASAPCPNLGDITGWLIDELPWHDLEPFACDPACAAPKAVLACEPPPQHGH